MFQLKKTKIGRSVRITSNVPIPRDVMTTIYRSLREAPDNFSHREVEELIRERPSCVGDAFSILIPDFGSAFKRIAGFKIPLNQRLLVELLRTALAEDDTDEATIISCIFQSVRIAKSGKLKTLSLNIILKVLLLIAKSGQLPGIAKRIPISKCRLCHYSKQIILFLTFTFLFLKFSSSINCIQK